MAEYWGAERIGKRLGVARSTVWQLIDRGQLLAFTRPRGPRKYLWTDDTLILVGNIEEANRYAKNRRLRKMVREALRAGQRPANPSSRPAPLAQPAGRGRGEEQPQAPQRLPGCLTAPTDVVAHVPPIQVGGPYAGATEPEPQA
jgi:hypothetical protein